MSDTALDGLSDIQLDLIKEISCTLVSDDRERFLHLMELYKGGLLSLFITKSAFRSSKWEVEFQLNSKTKALMSLMDGVKY